MSLFDDLVLASWSAGRRLDRIEERLGEIEKLLRSLKRSGDSQMATLADIRAEVEQQQTVIASAVTLLQSLAQMLRDAIASNDPAAIQEIVDMLDQGEHTLAAAVAENTPGA